MSSDVLSASSPIILTGPGRQELRERLARADDRLTRIEAELQSGRDESLVAEQLQLRAQVEELTGVLARAVAPSEVRDDPSVVELGDEVQVRFPDETTESFFIVHPVEAGLDERGTSSESPLARAVVGRRIGDRVTVTSPAGVYHCTIVDRRRIA